MQRSYDHNRARLVTVSKGAQPLQAKIAIYLIFQPKGLLASTIQTCRMLDAAGYAPLIVSNAPLPADDLATLREVCWRVLQRPNYGYDFGGYRDGILHLWENDISLERLLVMNDSIWYPLGDEDNLLTRLEASGLDVAGTIVHRRFKKTILRRKDTKVIESYLFSFSRRAVNSEVFEQFWRTYRMSSIKYNAVHNGERRVAETMMAKGLSADGLFGREEFLALLRKQDTKYLQDALRFSCYTNREFSLASKALLSGYADSVIWRDKALSHFERVSAKYGFLASFPFVAAGKMEIPLLKRTNGPLQSLARKTYLAAVGAEALPLPRPDMIAEIAARENMSIGDVFGEQAIGWE